MFCVLASGANYRPARSPSLKGLKSLSPVVARYELPWVLSTNKTSSTLKAVESLFSIPCQADDRRQAMGRLPGTVSLTPIR
jgi:hypothetical protein